MKTLFILASCVVVLATTAPTALAHGRTGGYGAITDTLAPDGWRPCPTQGHASPPTRSLPAAARLAWSPPPARSGGRTRRLEPVLASVRSSAWLAARFLACKGVRECPV